jgi:hypothetical protein
MLPAALARRPASLALVFASLQIGGCRWSPGRNRAPGRVGRPAGGASDPHFERARNAQRHARLSRCQDYTGCHFGRSGTSRRIAVQGSIVPHRVKRDCLLLHIFGLAHPPLALLHTCSSEPRDFTMVVEESPYA